MNSTLLVWDSQFFGFSIAKIELPTDFDPKELTKSLSEADAAYIFTAPKLGAAHEELLRQVGAVKYDVKTIFERQLPLDEMMPQEGKMAVAFNHELEQLAWAAGSMSRFYLDPRFRPFYRQLYSQWLRNAFELPEHAAIVVNDSGKTAGMATIAVDGKCGSIGLLAVANESRGRGVGTKLVKAAMVVCVTRGANYCRVATQADNHAACSLYRSCGFNVVKQEAVWHWHRPE